MERRPGLAALVVTGLVVTGSLLAGSACSQDRPRARPRPAATTAPPATAPDVTLKAGRVTVEAVVPGTPVPSGTADAALAAVGGYVRAATAGPLIEGRARDLGRVFGAPALARLAGPDRGVVLDEGLPRPTRTPRLAAQPVSLSILVDRDGRPVLASASLSLRVDAVAAAGPYTVRRDGELTLAPAGAGWQVAGYDLLVARDGAGLRDADGKAAS